MARRKSKGAEARNADNADSTSAAQTRISRTSQPQPRRSKPERVAAGKSAGKVQQCHQVRPKITPVPASAVSCPKTAVKTEQLSVRIRSQAQTSQKKRPTAMAGHKQGANPASNGVRAQLEVPEGYVFKTKKTTKRRNRTKKTTETPIPEPEPVRPWEIDREYPKPQDDTKSFNYERNKWRSFGNKDAKKEIEKALARGSRARLPQIFPDSTPEQLERAQRIYWSKNERKLYHIRLTKRAEPILSRLFIVAFQRGGYAKDMSPANDNNWLVKLLRVGELGKFIIEYLSLRDLTAVAAACKHLAICVEKYLEFWNFSTGSFPITDFIEKRQKDGRLLQADGIRSKILVISPVPEEPRNETPYMSDFLNLQRLCVAMTKIPWSFRSIILDQIPYLDVSMFEMMINSMPNLETVVVSRCLLLDITKLKPLLDVIMRHPRSLKDGSKATNPSCQGTRSSTAAYIRFDFFPFFFKGPNSAKRLGSYGVTWNEPTFNTPKAVFALILRCWELAKEVGMDLVSDSSLFWSFVRQLPGPDVLWAVKAREALLTREYDLAEGKKSKKDIWNSFADDITAALTGDNQKHPKAPERMARYLPSDHGGPYYWRNKARCSVCNFHYPLSLFPIRPGVCWGCKAESFLKEMEDSHLRQWLRSVISIWLYNLDPRNTTLNQLLSSNRKPIQDAAEAEAENADHVWRYFVNLPSANNGWMDAKPLYYPPPPPGLAKEVAALIRWLWKCSPATEPFDYREGGPQRKDPCKEPLSVADFQDPDCGGEIMENFNLRWMWSPQTDRVYAEYWVEKNNLPPFTDMRDPRVQEELRSARQDPKKCRIARDLERRAQNKLDKEVYRFHHPLVEDCLYSMGTPGFRPFNLDQPVLDPVVNKKEYDELIRYQQFQSSPYGYTSMRSNF